MLIFAHTNINNFLSFKAFCLISTYTLIFLPSLLYRSQGNLRLPQILQALNIKHLFEVLYLRDKITIELRLELNQMSSCRTSQINQSISRSIDHSINQSNCLMANASSMILSQEHVGMIRPTGNTCKQILIYMTRFMLQIVTVVSSIQVEAVSLTHYFIFYDK